MNYLEMNISYMKHSLIIFTSTSKTQNMDLNCIETEYFEKRINYIRFLSSSCQISYSLKKYATRSESISKISRHKL